eukprot:5881910-Alexandrium_andersonii.AAC.1
MCIRDRPQLSGTCTRRPRCAWASSARGSGPSHVAPLMACCTPGKPGPSLGWTMSMKSWAISRR